MTSWFKDKHLCQSKGAEGWRKDSKRNDLVKLKPLWSHSLGLQKLTLADDKRSDQKLVFLNGKNFVLRPLS